MSATVKTTTDRVEKFKIDLLLLESHVKSLRKSHEMNPTMDSQIKLMASEVKFLTYEIAFMKLFGEMPLDK